MLSPSSSPGDILLLIDQAKLAQLHRCRRQRVIPCSYQRDLLPFTIASSLIAGHYRPHTPPPGAIALPPSNSAIAISLLYSSTATLPGTRRFAKHQPSCQSCCRHSILCRARCGLSRSHPYGSRRHGNTHYSGPCVVDSWRDGHRPRSWSFDGTC